MNESQGICSILQEVRRKCEENIKRRISLALLNNS